MILSELQITHLRNIDYIKSSVHPHINLITGDNGSGKTTFLEALYLLSSAHSFRTRDILPLLSRGKDVLSVFAKTGDEQSISIQKSLQSPTVARINGQTCHSRSELASFFPCLLFNQDLFTLIDGGPSVRRELLDWGMFHVEHEYHGLWKNYYRALLQRNALLKQKAARSALQPWNKLLSDYAVPLDAFRSRYVYALNDKFKTLSNQLAELACSLEYVKGWDKRNEGVDLESILTQSYDRDIVRQYTAYGPHQADLIIQLDDYKAKEYLSRGQKKLILFALKMAQSTFLTKSCAYLIDDIASELDDKNLRRLLDFISIQKGQFFITSQDLIDLSVPHQSIVPSQIKICEEG